MKKTALPILVLLLSSLSSPLVAEAQAPEPPNVATLGPLVICSAGDSATYVRISSPQNKSYSDNPTQLNFSVVAFGMFGQFGNVGYSLDGGVIYSVSNFVNKSVDNEGTPDWYWNRTTVFASINLPTLSEGVHSATVYYGWQYLGTNNPSLERYEVFAYATVDFTVGKPTILPSTTKPSIPEFTVEVGDSKAIEVTIKNQPFVPYYDANSGWNISLYYDIRVKEHTEQNWTKLYLIEDVPIQSNSGYTNLSYLLSDENTDSYILGDKILEFPPSSQIDFQVEAMIGYVHRVLNPNATSQLDLYPYVFTGEESGWSNTQTLTIGENLPPSTELSVFQIAIVIGVLVIVAVAIGLFVYIKKAHRDKSS